MRPRPLAAGFQPCRPGNVWRAENAGSSAADRRDRLSAMPLAVTHFTNSRREGRMLPPLAQCCHAWSETNPIDACSTAAGPAQGYDDSARIIGFAKFSTGERARPQTAAFTKRGRREGLL